MESQVGGFEDVAKQLEGMGDLALPALAAGLFARAEAIMAVSSPLVPVDEGILRGSGFVEPPVVNGTDASVTLGYGGDAAAYALKQHEDLSLQHPNGGQAKYLEGPVTDALPTLPQDLADDVVDAYRRLVAK